MQVSNYDFPLYLENKNSLSVLINRIKPKSRILEFGTANGRLTKYLREEMHCQVYGIELDEEAAANASKYTNEILVDDIENYEWVKIFQEIKFDYILFADVLEHLYYPEKVLEKVKNMLSEDGSILISIPNVAHNAVIMDLLNSKFTYRKTGLLDKTHIRFYTKKTFLEVLKKLNFQIVYEDEIIIKPIDTEFKYRYSDFGNEISSMLKQLPYSEVYQFIYELKFSMSHFPKINNNSNDLFGPKCQLYISNNNSFNEDTSIKKSIQNPTFNLSKYKNIDMFRFDPIDDYLILKINSININNINFDLNLLNSNAFFVDKNIFYFDTQDPQIYFSLNTIELIQDVSFNIEYLYVGEETRKLFSEKYNELLKDSSRSEALHVKELEEKNTEQALHVKELEDKNREQALHVKELEEKNTEQALHVKELEDKNREQALHVKELEDKNREQALHVKELEDKNREQALHVKELEDTLLEKDALVDALYNELNNLQDELLNIYAQRSWTTTRIFRKIQGLMK